MPYIEQSVRSNIKTGMVPTTAGELNYLFTITAQEFLVEKGVSYEALNAIIGALESCKLEFYRRMTAPYEDEKIARNGDVYGDF